MALHVHYKTLYISQPFSAKQQREITLFWVFKPHPHEQFLGDNSVSVANVFARVHGTTNDMFNRC